MLKPIIKEDGVNDSERRLASQSVKTFFSLWCYPNLYRDEGKGKEITDLLVYFDNQIILFSDKGETKFQSEKDLKLAWKRWYKASVTESAKQLYGAESFIRRSRNHIFLDRKCKEAFPFDISDSGIKIHLVSIVRGISTYAKKYFDSFEVGSSGSLIHEYLLTELENGLYPFTIGDVHKGKSFVHVIDDLSIDLLFRELDCPADFLHYLNAKEAAVRGGRLIGAAGEEDILGFYLQEMESTGFGKLSPEIQGSDYWRIPEHEWHYYIQSEKYKLRTAWRGQCRRWANIVANFSDCIVDATVGEFSDQSILLHAKAVECLASENLLSRVQLTYQLFDKYDSVPLEIRSARGVSSICKPDRIYIFLFFPQSAIIQDLEEYRRQRFAWMRLYGWVSRLEFPKFKEIIVFGSSTKGMQSISETILAIDSSVELTSAEKRKAQKIKRDFKIFTDIISKQTNETPSKVLPIQPATKVGRNQLCPCNSGKKFKRCCITAYF